MIYLAPPPLFPPWGDCSRGAAGAGASCGARGGGGRRDEEAAAAVAAAPGRKARSRPEEAFCMIAVAELRCEMPDCSKKTGSR